MPAVQIPSLNSGACCIVCYVFSGQDIKVVGGASSGAGDLFFSPGAQASRWGHCSTESFLCSLVNAMMLLCLTWSGDTTRQSLQHSSIHRLILCMTGVTHLCRQAHSSAHSEYEDPSYRVEAARLVRIRTSTTHQGARRDCKRDTEFVAGGRCLQAVKRTSN